MDSDPVVRALVAAAAQAGVEAHAPHRLGGPVAWVRTSEAAVDAKINLTAPGDLDDREIYLIRLTGSFTVRSRPHIGGGDERTWVSPSVFLKVEARGDGAGRIRGGGAGWTLDLTDLGAVHHFELDPSS